MEEKNSYIAKTLTSLEDLLVDELKALGIEELSKGIRAVEFTATREQVYKANLWCRTAIRILKNIVTFPVTDEQSLYDGLQKIEWDQYLSANDTLAVDSVLYNSNFQHSLFISQKAKDAIVDQFRKKYNVRPSVDLERPTLRVHVFISRNECTVSLDTSGSSLHKRGYRNYGNEAPLNEVLAAGMILLSGWNGKTSFVDFMCGSGTLLIEAGLIAKNIAPGLYRDEFGFERWKDHDSVLWGGLLEQARNSILPELDIHISGCDISERNTKIAWDNVDNARLSEEVDIYKMSFEDFAVPKGGGTLVTNPPYGERMTPENIEELYKKIGDKLKKDFAGYTACILTANMEAAKHIGLRPSRRIPLLNSQLECRFLKFEMYEGSKKAKYNQPQQ
jgi:putative N6-adenine-specific DNA methylase